MTGSRPLERAEQEAYQLLGLQDTQFLQADMLSVFPLLYLVWGGGAGRVEGSDPERIPKLWGFVSWTSWDRQPDSLRDGSETAVVCRTEEGDPP